MDSRRYLPILFWAYSNSTRGFRARLLSHLPLVEIPVRGFLCFWCPYTGMYTRGRTVQQ